MTTHTIIRQGWIEHERGWGLRPDDDSLHLTMEDRHQFVKEYWEKMPDHAPDEYSSPDLEPESIVVNELTFQVLTKQRAGELPNKFSLFGIWLVRMFCPSEGGIVYRPPTWFEKRLKAQGFNVKDFGKQWPATVDHKKHAAFAAKLAAEEMSKAFDGDVFLV